MVCSSVVVGAEVSCVVSLVTCFVSSGLDSSVVAVAVVAVVALLFVKKIEHSLIKLLLIVAFLSFLVVYYIPKIM